MFRRWVKHTVDDKRGGIPLAQAGLRDSAVVQWLMSPEIDRTHFGRIVVGKNRGRAGFFCPVRITQKGDTILAKMFARQFGLLVWKHD